MVLHNHVGQALMTLNGSNPLTEAAQASVTVVTVTYGDRWQLLQQMLARVEPDPAVERIIVIENGTTQAVSPQIAAAGFRKVTVVRSERNVGSAAGFTLGLKAARDYGPTWVWILDDDNLPEPTALAALLRAARRMNADALGRSALSAFRPALQADVASGVSVRHCFPPHSSFCGFHIADIPFKIWRRVGWRQAAASHTPELIDVPYAPFGGLFFHSTLLDRIGAPNEALVLYADDTEFSHRIVGSGGHIWLLPAAVVRELESSWSSKTAVRSSFERWLQRGSDLQVFYGARNRANFERNTWIRSKTMYSINRFTYLSLLRVFAARHHRVERYKLFRRAVKLGEQGRLGMSEDFPLH